jgi:peptide subunit release factor 1 (eRF1)
LIDDFTAGCPEPADPPRQRGTAPGGLGGPAGVARDRHGRVGHLDQLVLRLVALDRTCASRLVLAGPDEIPAEIAERLPESLLPRVAAFARMDATAQSDDVLEMTHGVVGRIRAQHEIGLVEELVERARSGGFAVCGVLPSLTALGLAEVATILIAEDLNRPGAACSLCGWLGWGVSWSRLGGARSAAGPCPRCAATLGVVPDVAAVVTRQAEDRGAAVEVVHGDAARLLVAMSGGAGALLRGPASGATRTAPGQPARACPSIAPGILGSRPLRT